MLNPNSPVNPDRQYFKTKAFPRLQCISLWMAGIMFFRIVHMSDWHCESRADSGMENDRDGCLGLEIQGHRTVSGSKSNAKSIGGRASTVEGQRRMSISKKNRVIHGEEILNQSVFQIIAVRFYLM